MHEELKVAQLIPNEKKELREKEVARAVESFKRGERNDLVRIGKRLAKYLHDQKITRVAFLDRGARQAYICLMEAWKKLYPEEEPPEVYFFNPLGFNSTEMMDDLVPPYNLPRHLVLSSRLVTGENPRFLEVSESHIEAPFTGRQRGKILEEFESTYRKLVADKSASLLIFETCQHTGISTDPIMDILHQSGFTDVRLGLASHVNDLASTKPDFVALKGEATGKCWPFHRDSLVEKSSDTLHSRAIRDPEARHRGIILNKAIRQIVNELWDKIY